MMATKHKMKRIEAGEYEYRGKTIMRDDNVPNGYWGRWRTVGGKSHRFETLAEAKAYIDSKRTDD